MPYCPDNAAGFGQRLGLSVYGAPVLLSHVFPVPGVPPSVLRFDVHDDGRIVPRLAATVAPTTADRHNVAQALLQMHRAPLWSGWRPHDSINTVC